LVFLKKNTEGLSFINKIAFDFKFLSILEGHQHRIMPRLTVKIEQKIIKWYQSNKRDLPWRSTKEPYKIWVSEVILQQTRVDQALAYYHAFINKFPDVIDLANAHEQDVLKIWQGLGYYSRARNMHQTAIYIANNLNGKLPESYNELLKLKGIGTYTAAAIASFAWKEAVAVVDGNVFRVLARIFAEISPINTSKGKKVFTKLAADLIQHQQADIFNQAIMEFGALQCTPKKPNCQTCPLQENCLAFANKQVNELPVKIKPPQKKQRFFNYLVIQKGETTFIQRRANNDIWKGLFEFPLIETTNKVDNKEFFIGSELASLIGKVRFTLRGISKLLLHQLSHQTLNVVFFKLSIDEQEDTSIFETNYTKINFSEIKNYPVPRIIEKFIDSFEFS
jgi:A/G-specific adenine glycosylase